MSIFDFVKMRRPSKGTFVNNMRRPSKIYDQKGLNYNFQIKDIKIAKILNLEVKRYILIYLFIFISMLYINFSQFSLVTIFRMG